jgi:broad specificity phosphatase PhoE
LARVPEIVLVRHAAAVIQADEPRGQWPISPAGAVAAATLGDRLADLRAARRAVVAASGETKAIRTAEELSLGEVRIDPRFGEVTKPWYPDDREHRDATTRYLRGHDLEGWERRADALDRFTCALSDLSDLGDLDAELLVIASHGTVMSLWIGERIPAVDPVEFWLGLRMPDAHLVDTERGTVARLAP